MSYCLPREQLRTSWGHVIDAGQFFAAISGLTGSGDTVARNLTASARDTGDQPDLEVTTFFAGRNGSKRQVIFDYESLATKPSNQFET